MTPCLICQEETPSIHWHHTIFQSTGGVDSEQVPLCANCHNGVHREVNRLMARHRKKLQLGGIKWGRPKHANELQIAAKIIQVGLKGVITYEATNASRVKMQLALELPLHTALKQLKVMGRFSTLEQTVEECIKLALHMKGIKITEGQLPNRH